MALVVNTNISSLAAQRNLAVNQASLWRRRSSICLRLAHHPRHGRRAGLGRVRNVAGTYPQHQSSHPQRQRRHQFDAGRPMVRRQSIGNLLGSYAGVGHPSGPAGRSERRSVPTWIRNSWRCGRKSIVFQRHRIQWPCTLERSSNSFRVFVGFKSGANNVLSLDLNDLDLTSVGLASVEYLLSGQRARRIVEHRQCDQRGGNRPSEYGSDPKSFRAAIANLQVTSENFTAADSDPRCRHRVRDVAVYQKPDLTQSGIAMLAQANALPQQALALLRG